MILFIFIGVTFLIFIASGGYIAFAFSGYMFFEAMEHWEWIESNWIDDFFAWLYVNIESNIIVGLMVAPVKEVLSAYLYLEEENRFSMMNEY